MCKICSVEYFKSRSFWQTGASARSCPFGLCLEQGLPALNTHRQGLFWRAVSKLGDFCSLISASLLFCCSCGHEALCSIKVGADCAASTWHILCLIAQHDMASHTTVLLHEVQVSAGLKSLFLFLTSFACVRALFLCELNPSCLCYILKPLNNKTSQYRWLLLPEWPFAKQTFKY